MAIIGYARTSTAEQIAGLDAQARDLTAAGCEKMFHEQVSGSTAKRAQLQAALNRSREGDTLVACKPDRLARSTADFLSTVARLETKDLGLIILSMGGQCLDTRSPTGKLMMTMLAAVAEFERAPMLERQREGIAKARNEGRYKGSGAHGPQPVRRGAAASDRRQDPDSDCQAPGDVAHVGPQDHSIPRGDGAGSSLIEPRR